MNNETIDIIVKDTSNHAIVCLLVYILGVLMQNDKEGYQHVLRKCGQQMPSGE